MNPEPTIARQLQAVARLERQIEAEPNRTRRESLEASRDNRLRHAHALIKKYRGVQAIEQAGMPVQQK
jgi:glucose-6-phosphate dehydrogenase assembly protein OpcA